MKPNNQFSNRSLAFWAHARLISEKLNYSKNGLVKKYTLHEVENKLTELGIVIDLLLLKDVLEYLDHRATLLNESVKNMLMNAHTAREQFENLHSFYLENNFTCHLPLNKQKGEKREIAYYTAIVNILAEKTLREYASKHTLIYGEEIKFNDNPLSLTYFTDSNGKLQAIMSRRFDGALPETINPLAIWEIKEYYYTTTFGSRIADGVYETQLDGYEAETISRETEKNVKHIYFIDDFNTWWNMGKSYLCRIIDMLHMGLVDEVIFGKEVIERWPTLITEILSMKT